MELHRVEMMASIIFDVVMPEGATDQEINAQAVSQYRAALDGKGGFDLVCALDTCRVYIYTVEGVEPADVWVASSEEYVEDED